MALRPLLLAALSLAALPALGEGVRFVHPSAGMSFAAGDEVMVRWTAGPKDAEEMELMLSLDGGRHFSIRLTEEMEGDAASYLWRVPDLPSGAARLGLRANVGGREMEVGESAPFAITMDERGQEPGAGSIRFRDGEVWWMERVVPGSDAGSPLPAGLDPMPPEPQFLPAAGEWMLANRPSPQIVSRPAKSSRSLPTLPSTASRPAVKPPARAPLLTPLRI